jgi:hypothetical protein
MHLRLIRKNCLNYKENQKNTMEVKRIPQRIELSTIPEDKLLETDIYQIYADEDFLTLNIIHGEMPFGLSIRLQSGNNPSESIPFDQNDLGSEIDLREYNTIQFSIDNTPKKMHYTFSLTLSQND